MRMKTFVIFSTRDNTNEKSNNFATAADMLVGVRIFKALHCSPSPSLSLSSSRFLSYTITSECICYNLQQLGKKMVRTTSYYFCCNRSNLYFLRIVLPPSTTTTARLLQLDVVLQDDFKVVFFSSTLPPLSLSRPEQRPLLPRAEPGRCRERERVRGRLP